MNAEALLGGNFSSMDRAIMVDCHGCMDGDPSSLAERPTDVPL